MTKNPYSRTYQLSLEQERRWRAQAQEDPDAFWSARARELLDWDTPFTVAHEENFREGQISWFSDGTLNVSVNCIDRHLATRAEQVALIWEANNASEGQSFTYRALYQEVCHRAALLTSLGVSRGDRVALYLPMMPDLVFFMLACARIGAIHSVVFAGFSAHALRDRILDSTCSVVVTSNVGLRGEKILPLKAIVDDALVGVGCVRTVLVARRTADPVTMIAGRDLWVDEALCQVEPNTTPPEAFAAEEPLFILYTSGSTGTPKGVLHTSAGYLLYTAMTHRYVFDYQDGDVFFCAADIGWITGHSYVVYGPLCNGATTVMFESTPLFPTPARYWETIERHQVNIFYTAPTAIRTLEKEGTEWTKPHEMPTLRLLGSVGEPINIDAWNWYFQNVGKERAPIVDTWWQTETGGILISALPSQQGLKPGSAQTPFFGIQPVLVDDDKHEILENGVKGHLCLKGSWPGQARTVYRDHERYIDTYFKEVPGMYLTGDAAERDADGDYWIRGRTDDVLNVSGHRLGTSEIEGALNHSPHVVEAAVVGFPHEIKGTGIYAFCISTHSTEDKSTMIQEIRDTVRHVIGAMAIPDHIHFCPALPKTRSGKIMRRILRKIAAGEFESLGDTTTLADPDVVHALVKERQRELAGKKP